MDGILGMLPSASFIEIHVRCSANFVFIYIFFCHTSKVLVENICYISIIYKKSVIGILYVMALTLVEALALLLGSFKTLHNLFG